MSKQIILLCTLLFACYASGNNFSTKGLLYPEVVTEFYQSRHYKDVWTDSKLVEQLQQAIAGAYLHGLQPADYHYADLAKGSDALRTDAFIAYAHDLRFGRAAHRLKGRDWEVTHKDSELIPVLETAISTGEFRKQLEGLAPSFEAYRVLQEKLGEYRELAAKGEWPVFDQSLDSDAADPDQLNLLRRRLELTKDMDDKTQLVDGVIRFQSRHGLNPDGIIGKQTLAALNADPAHRVTQIKLNLERLRWLPHQLPERFILVNVPAFELRIYDQHKMADSMRVIVGRRSWVTPTFVSSAINRIILNPYWYVPSAIANKEIYPLLQKEPDYLERNAIQIIPDSQGNLRLRQKPGERNSLGRIKFLFPNCCDCYLHDTPEKQLFDKVLRSFSHGCIRVEDAFGVADWILETEGWSEDRLSEAIESDKTQTITLTKTVPIYIVYFTAWVDADGSMQFRNDVYLKDKQLAPILGAGQMP